MVMRIAAGHVRQADKLKVRQIIDAYIERGRPWRTVQTRACA